MSRSAMNMPKHMARNATSRRGSMRSDAVAVVMSAMESTRRRVVLASPVAPSATRSIASRQQADTRHRHPGRRRRALISDRRLGVDADHDRHAGAEQALHRDVSWDTHPYRNTLHDLGEIAGRVVGRKQ